MVRGDSRVVCALRAEGLRLVVRRLVQPGRVGRSVPALQLEHLGGRGAGGQSRQSSRLQSRHEHRSCIQPAHRPAGLHGGRAERARRDAPVEPGAGRSAMADSLLPRHPMGQSRRPAQVGRVDDRVRPPGQRPGRGRHTRCSLRRRRPDLRTSSKTTQHGARGPLSARLLRGDGRQRRESRDDGEAFRHSREGTGHHPPGQSPGPGARGHHSVPARREVLPQAVVQPDRAGFRRAGKADRVSRLAR